MSKIQRFIEKCNSWCYYNRDICNCVLKVIEIIVFIAIWYELYLSNCIAFD